MTMPTMFPSRSVTGPPHCVAFSGRSVCIAAGKSVRRLLIVVPMLFILSLLLRTGPVAAPRSPSAISFSITASPRWSFSLIFSPALRSETSFVNV